MTKPADDKLGHAKREIKALTGQLAEARARMSMLESFIEGVEKNAEQSNPEWNFVCKQALAGGSKAWLLRQKAKALYDLGCTEPSLMHKGIPAWTINCIDLEYKRLRDAADKSDGAL
jgi:hypothetical protein